MVGIELPAERLAHFKASLRERYLEPARSLAEAARQGWGPVRYRSYGHGFDKRRRKAAALERVTLQDLVAFYTTHLVPTAPTARVLCCELNWCLVPDGGFDAVFFAGLAIVTMCLASARWDALIVLAFGGVYFAFSYYFNLEHVSNAVMLWLGMRPADGARRL
eukprot:XP_001689621.1 predicted protein [Chlamydomonas reinhardtii]